MDRKRTFCSQFSCQVHILVLAAVLLATPGDIQAQNPGRIDWQHSYGGTHDDGGHACVIDPDGSIIFAGWTSSGDGDLYGLRQNSAADNDVWVTKLSPYGKRVWQITTGGSGNDEADCIIRTSDHGYLVVGSTSSHDGDVVARSSNLTCGWAVKLDSNGTVTWRRSIHAQLDCCAEIHSCCQLKNGNFALAGEETGSYEGLENHGSIDAYVVILSPDGGILSERTYGGRDQDVANSILETDDGGLLFAGATRSANDGDVSGRADLALGPNDDAWVVKLDASGTIQWQHAYGGSLSESATKVIASKVGYVFCGDASSIDFDVSGNHGLQDVWVVAIDSVGTLLWQSSLGGTRSDYGRGMVMTSTGGYAAVGYTSSTDGDVLDIHQTLSQKDSGIAASDVWVVWLDSVGHKDSQRCLGGTAADLGYSVSETPDSGLVVCGYSASEDGDVSHSQGSGDAWIVRLGAGSKLSIPITPVVVERSPSTLVKSYPNPSSEEVHLQLFETQTVNRVQCYDVMGREVTPSVLLGANVATVGVKGLPPGAYVVRITFSYNSNIVVRALPIIVMR